MKIRTKSNKVDKRWLASHVNDPWVRQAQKEGYRSRAAYKLQQIDEELSLLEPGQRVVDLGAAPGAWSQYVRRRFAPREAGTGGAAAGQLDGAIIALDLLEVEPIEGVQFIQGDFREPEVLARLEAALGGRRVDVVLSDLAPNLSGIASADAARIEHLVELALDFAAAHLAPTGTLVCKVFHGGSYDPLARRFRDAFKFVKAIKPKASRDRSAETFLVGRVPKGRRPEEPAAGDGNPA